MEILEKVRLNSIVASKSMLDLFAENKLTTE